MCQIIDFIDSSTKAVQVDIAGLVQVMNLYKQSRGIMNKFLLGLLVLSFSSISNAKSIEAYEGSFFFGLGHHGFRLLF